MSTAWTNEDGLLLLRCQQGDAGAFADVVTRWHGRLFSHALRLTGDREAAADLMQETWLAVFRGLGRLEDVDAFPAWAFRIVTHKAADWVRSQRRRRYLSAGLSAEAVVRNSPARRPAARVQSLQQALERLTPEQRGLITLYYAEGFSTEEIAGILGIPRGTVKSRLHHARLQVLSLMEPATNGKPGEADP